MALMWHQVEAVENHMPEIVIVDEIGTEAEALACRTIAERGVQLIATAHGQLLENLLKNPTLSDLVGGIQSVTLGENSLLSWTVTLPRMQRRVRLLFELDKRNIHGCCYRQLSSTVLTLRELSCVR